MKGHYNFTVENRRIKYIFTISSNITVIRGDSGTGKTQLINMIEQYCRYGADSGVDIQTEAKFYASDSLIENWEQRLSEIRDTVVFLDEEMTFTSSKEFSEVVKNSSNYYVIVSRNPLKYLPYSIKEVYQISAIKQDDILQKVTNVFTNYADWI